MVFIPSILALLTAFLSTFIAILPFDFGGLTPWIADVAPSQNATIVASMLASPSPWTNTEIIMNVSASVLLFPSAGSVVAVPSAAVLSSSVPSPVVPLSAPQPSPSAYQPGAGKPKDPRISDLFFVLLSLIREAILRATLAVNDFLGRHNPVLPAKQRVLLSRTGGLSDDETPRGKRLALFRLLRNSRLRRGRTLHPRWGMDPVPAEVKAATAAPPTPPPTNPAATAAHLAALAVIKGLGRKIEGLEKELEESKLANEQLRKELLVHSVTTEPVSSSPGSASSVSAPSPVVGSSPAPVSLPPAAVSCLKATAPEFNPAFFAPPPSPAVFSPVASLPPPPPPPPPTAPMMVQPMYGARYDAGAFQYQQQQMQLERERRARAQWSQPQSLPANPAQAMEAFRRQFPNHGKKA